MCWHRSLQSCPIQNYLYLSPGDTLQYNASRYSRAKRRKYAAWGSRNQGSLFPLVALIHRLYIMATTWMPCDITLRWRHNGRDSVSHHQPHDCLLNRLFRRRSKKTSKLRVTGLCAENSPETGEFSAQMASNAVNISIWWRHHDTRQNQRRRCTHEHILGTEWRRHDWYSRG